MHPRLEFQRRHCRKGLKILNVGSKEDPAKLKQDFGAINIDINKFENVDVIADARMLPFKDKSVDVVVLGDCLEHMANPEKAVEEARRVSRGLIVATIPTIEHELEIGHKPAGYPYSEHVWKPTVDEIKRLFLGAEVKFLRTPDWIGCLVKEDVEWRRSKSS
jgi:SAM-dependent methyltransferase